MPCACTDHTKIVKRISDLLARAGDAGAAEEERRTSGVIAAKLMREHGITLGAEPSSSSPPQVETRVRIQAVIGGVHHVAEVMSQGLGFDVAAFAQNLLREKIQAAMTSVVNPSPPAPRRRRRRATKPRA